MRVYQSTWLGMSRKRLLDVVRYAGLVLYGVLVTASGTILPLPSEEFKSTPRAAMQGNVLGGSLVALKDCG